MRSLLLKRVLFCVSCFTVVFTPAVVSAEIVPDSTFSNSTAVSSDGCLVCEITGGRREGDNLFHVFETFSVDVEAYFNHSADIENIFSRVTGSAISNIDGTIRANGTANLFLLNPNGIVFGEEASLDIGGSFIASTAERILFEDGRYFDTFTSPSEALLSVTTPIGLQFGQNPGSITNASVANLAVDGSDIPVSGGLEVLPGQTLALVGNGLKIAGSVMIAPAGNIELGSVSDNSFVGLSLEDNQWNLLYDDIVNNYSDINLYNFSYLSTNGAGAGRIKLQGRDITFTEGSLVRALTLGTEAGDALIISAVGEVTLSGDLTALEVWSEDLGAASDIFIDASDLTIEQGAYIDSQGLIGQAGDITINTTGQVELSGVDSEGFQGGLFAEVYEDYDATLIGGNVTIDTEQLLIKDGAQISVATFGSASAGDLTIRAAESVTIEDSVDNEGRTGLFNQVNIGFDEDGNELLSSGNAGGITIATDRLSVSDGGKIQNSTFAAGNAGDTIIVASDIFLTGATPDGQIASEIAAEVSSEEATGNGGKLTIETQRLRVFDSAQISTAARNEGQGGSLSITATESILLNGILPGENLERNSSGIFVSAEPGALNDGGSLNLETDSLVVENGAKISADNRGSGNGSTAIINAREVLIQSGGRVGAGSLQDSGVDGSQLGPGGSFTLNVSERLQVSGSTTVDSTVINSELFTRAEGAGAAGDLTINETSDGSLNVIASEGAQISASTVSSTGGNLIFNNPDVVLLRSGGSIAAEAGSSEGSGDGGNITLNMRDGFVVAPFGENSDIVANAFSGDGGNINIVAQNIIGLEQRPATPNNSTNDIDASSQFGNSGTVTLNNLEIDPTQGLVELPANTTAPNQVAQRCLADSESLNAFIVTGQGGASPSPRDIVRNEAAGLVDLGNGATTPSIAPISSNSLLNTNTEPVTEEPIVEAQGWHRTPSGKVTLFAEATTAQTANNTAYLACDRTQRR